MILHLNVNPSHLSLGNLSSMKDAFTECKLMLFSSLQALVLLCKLAGIQQYCLFCSGLLPSLMGIAHVAIQFPLYEACKSWFQLRAMQTRNSKDLNTLELVTASAVSKMIASTATYPHEVLRSHMHVTGSGPFTGFIAVGKEVSASDIIVHQHVAVPGVLDFALFVNSLSARKQCRANAA